MKNQLLKILFAGFCIFATTTLFADGDIIPKWKKNFYDNGDDTFYSVTAVPDGFVACGVGDLNQPNRIGYIVKYDNAGNVVWKDNKSQCNIFTSVIAVSDGIIAVGQTYFYNWDYKYTVEKGVIVKYNNSGAIVWEKTFSGNVSGGHSTVFNSVTAVEDGFVAVGYASDNSFGTGDLVGLSKKGLDDAIVVKYDNAGNLKWKKNFGGEDDDYFNSVIAVPDGVIATGYSESNSFKTGDWATISGNGNDDAIIVKFDNSGTVVWKKNFGGNGDDYFEGVSLVFDGIIAAGYSTSSSFGNGDWTNITGKGGNDAIIVKYNTDGTEAWKKNFGGNGDDYFNNVTALPDGFVVVGSSSGFGNGDWAGVTGKGGSDATIVKFNNAGNVVIKKNFGGKGGDNFLGVTTDSDEFVAVGSSDESSFGNGDWEGVTAGNYKFDAIIVRFEPFYSVTDIVDVPTYAVIGEPRPLTCKVIPENATFQTVEWSVSSAGTTGAVIIDNTLYVTATGTALILATIKNGTAVDTDFTKLFFIKASNVGIPETEQEMFKATIYPNPTTGELRVKSEELIVERVEVFDVFGRKMLAEKQKTTLTVLQSYSLTNDGVVIDISHLPAGVYFVRIQTETGEIVRKVLKK